MIKGINIKIMMELKEAKNIRNRIMYYEMINI